MYSVFFVINFGFVVVPFNYQAFDFKFAHKIISATSVAKNFYAVNEKALRHAPKGFFLTIATVSRVFVGYLKYGRRTSTKLICRGVLVVVGVRFVDTIPMIPSIAYPILWHKSARDLFEFVIVEFLSFSFEMFRNLFGCAVNSAYPLRIFCFL